ncbi:MAG: DNA-3-methyladenine glycosylase I [Beijerinckiaceae bacterium]
MASPPRPALLHDDGLHRCPWCGTDPLYIAYHDEEWGVPEWDSRALFEKLILDGFQAGLSWITILRKRDAFRKAFDNFEPEKIVRYKPAKVEKLMQDAGIVRNRAKIESTIKSAGVWLDIEAGAGFSNYLWKYVDGAPIQGRVRSMADIPTESAISQAISKDLKKRGFNFCGPTIVYAFMQAVGMVNDHLHDCHRRQSCAELARPPEKT